MEHLEATATSFYVAVNKEKNAAAVSSNLRNILCSQSLDSKSLTEALTSSTSLPENSLHCSQDAQEL